MNVISVVGARPQFVKAAAVSRAFQAHPKVSHSLVHTGQHYHHSLSGEFFEQLELPQPTVNLGVGSAPHPVQVANIMKELWTFLQDLEDDTHWLLVYGDTNSSLAAALVGSKMDIPVAHIEAGVRCGDRHQPEEINRTLIDHMSSLLFCSSSHGVSNLLREDVQAEKWVVGDVMLDTLQEQLPCIYSRSTVKDMGLKPREYYVATVHRQESTRDMATLMGIFDGLACLGLPVVLPLHPRTWDFLKVYGYNWAQHPEIRFEPSMSYLDMMALMRGARVILTDSGGIQKEAYWLSVPCVVLSKTTSWTELVTEGYSTLAGTDCDSIRAAVGEFQTREPSASLCGDIYGDGSAAERIAKILPEVRVD